MKKLFRTKPMVPCKTTLGAFIRKRRLELQMSQITLSIAAGFGNKNQYISAFERGARTYLSQQQLVRLAEALQVDPPELRAHMSPKPIFRPNHSLAILLREKREKLGLSQREFAEKLKISLQKVRYLESDMGKKLTYSLAREIGIILNLDPSSLSEFVGFEKKQTQTKFGGLIRESRKKIGLSTEDLAKRLGVSRQYLNNLELAAHVPSNIACLNKLASELDLDINVLVPAKDDAKVMHDKRPMLLGKALGQFIKTQRMKRGLTQGKVAESVGISITTISLLETGDKLRVQPANLKRVSKLAEFFDCEIPEKLLPISQKKS